MFPEFLIDSMSACSFLLFAGWAREAWRTPAAEADGSAQPGVEAHPAPSGDPAPADVFGRLGLTCRRFPGTD